MFHSNAAFRILETVMNSCAPFSLVHNVNPRHRGTSGFSYKIKFNVTPSSGMMHKSSVWFAWTLLNSPILCKYKPSLEYYVRNRNKVIQGFQWESGTKCNSGWYYVGLMSRLLLQFLAFTSFFSFQKKMFFPDLLVFWQTSMHQCYLYTVVCEELRWNCWRLFVFTFLLDEQWG